jgi:hypothetical protein
MEKELGFQMIKQLEENPSLADFADTEDEAIKSGAEFTPKYQLFQLYKGVLSLQAQGQYKQARQMFYENLSWFIVMFDHAFPERCKRINERYNNPELAKVYTYEQLEQLKYMCIVTDFARMLIDISSKNRVTINSDPNKQVELNAVGFPQILDYQAMALELFTNMFQIQQQRRSRKDVDEFFNMSLGWFGGIFDSKFLKMGYLISKTEQPHKERFMKLLSEFSKLLVRKHVISTAMAQLSYKPRTGANIPFSVKDIVKEITTNTPKPTEPANKSKPTKTTTNKRVKLKGVV